MDVLNTPVTVHGFITDCAGSLCCGVVIALLMLAVANGYFNYKKRKEGL